MSYIPLLFLQKNKAVWSSGKIKSQIFLGIKRRKTLYINLEKTRLSAVMFMYSKYVCIENRLLYGTNRLLYSRKTTQSWIRQICPLLFAYMTLHMPLDLSDSIFFFIDIWLTVILYGISEIMHIKLMLSLR